MSGLLSFFKWKVAVSHRIVSDNNLENPVQRRKNNYMEATIRHFGTLYSGNELIQSRNGYAYSVGDRPRDIVIRDTVPGLEISWVEYDGMFMSQYPLLRKISFEDLKYAGVIHGKQVQVDGTRYELRLLRGGTHDNPSADDYWVRAIQKENGTIWRNADFRCWGYRAPSRDSYIIDSALSALTDSDSPIWTAILPPDTRSEVVGWRPVLEPVFEDPAMLPDGAPVWIFFSDGSSVAGSLREYSDYDLVLSDSNGYGQDSACRHIGDHLLVVERNSIQELRRIRNADRYCQGGIRDAGAD